MENLIVIRTIAQLKELQEFLKDKDYVGVDTETTGLDRECQVIGISVSIDTITAYYIILSYWDISSQTLIDLETKSQIISFIEMLTTKNLIMQHATYDCIMINSNFGIDLMPNVHTDTMILAHLLDENRSCGLKELGTSIFGEDATKEQRDMKESIKANGGLITKDKYELYKADSELIAKYGAKDALLTIKLFYHLIPELYEQKLDEFFFTESMPLLKGPTYDLNTTGLKVDIDRIQKLRGELEAECMETKAFIHKELLVHVSEKYKGTNKSNTFNINAPQQLSWLLFSKLDNTFNALTKEGRSLCKALELKLPYSPAHKAIFIRTCTEYKGRTYTVDGKVKKIGDPWKYLDSSKNTLILFAKRYKWVEKLLEYKKNTKILDTYIVGIQERMKYGIIRPSFLQHGTTSGRYSSRGPNFQNLPRDDKRIKSCIIARPGNVFVGADYSQLEPRVFTSVSQDPKLLECFEKGYDFYSTVGADVFRMFGYSLKKDDENSFAKKYPELRQIAKAIALSLAYGTTPYKMASSIGKSIDECRDIFNAYFHEHPGVLKMMLESHELAKTYGAVYSLYGRPRRMPEAKSFSKIYGNTEHSDLPYTARNVLNLAVNHRIQSTAASIMNRAAIAVYRAIVELSEYDKEWNKVKIILQVHDQLILEGPECLSDDMAQIVKRCMEETTILPGVKLLAEPFISKSLDGQK